MRHLLMFLTATLMVLGSGCQTMDQKYTSSTQGIKTSALPFDAISHGMSKEEVIATLGYPHINPETPETWIYIFIRNGKVTEDAFQITFVDGKVSSVERIDT